MNLDNATADFIVNSSKNGLKNIELAPSATPEAPGIGAKHDEIVTNDCAQIIFTTLAPYK